MSCLVKTVSRCCRCNFKTVTKEEIYFWPHKSMQNLNAYGYLYWKSQLKHDMNDHKIRQEKHMSFYTKQTHRAFKILSYAVQTATETYTGRLQNGLKHAFLTHIVNPSKTSRSLRQRRERKRESLEWFICKWLKNTRCPVTFLQKYLSLLLQLLMPAWCRYLSSPPKENLCYMYKYCNFCLNLLLFEKLPIFAHHISRASSIQYIT